MSFASTAGRTGVLWHIGAISLLYVYMYIYVISILASPLEGSSSRAISDPRRWAGSFGLAVASQPNKLGAAILI